MNKKTKIIIGAAVYETGKYKGLIADFNGEEITLFGNPDE